MDLVDATIVVVAAPAIVRDLGATPAQLQWVLAAYTFALGSGLITGGRIGDDYGHRRVLLGSLTAFAVASALCALAPTAPLLIGARVLQGVAAGLLVPQTLGIIRSCFDAAGQAKAFGAFGATQSLAAVVGPLLGGFLVIANLGGLGWRTIFWVNLPVAALALLIGLRVLPQSRQPQTTRLDAVGAALAAASVVLVLLPIVQGRDWGWPTWGWVILACGVLLFVAFLAYERRLAAAGGAPILDPALLRNRTFSLGLVASLLFFGGIGGFFLTLSIYLQQGTGRTAWDTGLIMLPYALGSIITSGIGIALGAKLGRQLLVAGALTLAAAHLLTWFLVKDGTDPGTWPLAGALFLGGLGLGLTAPILLSTILAGVPGRSAGTASGVLTSITQFGGAVGIAALGTIYFNTLASNTGAPNTLHAHAFANVLAPWEVACYLIAALLVANLRAQPANGAN